MQFVSNFSPPMYAHPHRVHHNTSDDNMAYLFDSRGRVYRVARRPSPPAVHHNMNYYDQARVLHTYSPQMHMRTAPTCCAEHVAEDARRTILLEARRQMQHAAAHSHNTTRNINHNSHQTNETTDEQQDAVPLVPLTEWEVHTAAAIQQQHERERQHNEAAERVQTWWRRSSQEQKKRQQEARENHAARVIAQAIRRRAAQVHSQREAVSMRQLRDLLTKTQQLKTTHHQSVLTSPHREPSQNGTVGRVNRQFLEYAHELDTIIVRVDQIDTQGSDTVRQYRRQVVRFAQDLLDALERHAAQSPALAVVQTPTTGNTTEPKNSTSSSEATSSTSETTTTTSVADTPARTEPAHAETAKPSPSPAASPVRKIPVRFADNDQVQTTPTAGKNDDRVTVAPAGDYTHTNTPSSTSTGSDTGNKSGPSTTDPSQEALEALMQLFLGAYTGQFPSKNNEHTTAPPAGDNTTTRTGTDTSAKSKPPSTTDSSQEEALDALMQLFLGGYPRQGLHHRGDTDCVNQPTARAMPAMFTSAQQGHHSRPQHGQDMRRDNHAGHHRQASPTIRVMPAPTYASAQGHRGHPQHYHHGQQHHPAAHFPGYGRASPQGYRAQCAHAAAPTPRSPRAGFYVPYGQWVLGQ